jgi:predicted permease
MRTLLSRIRALFRRRELDARLDEEVRAHLEELTEEYARDGASPEDARRAARRAFGNVESMKEAHRDRSGLRWIEECVQDLRYGLRGLRRNPGFAAAAIVTLALGIGANTAIFSLLDAVLLRPLPVTRPHELVMLQIQAGTFLIRPFTTSLFREFRRQRDVFADLAAFRPFVLRVDSQSEVALTSGQFVSGSYHSLLGVPLEYGRPLTAADDEPASAPATVISYGFWQRRFGGDPGAVGRLIEIEGRSFTVVGITGREFLGTQPGQMVEVTIPLAQQSLFAGNLAFIGSNDQARWLYLIGRLAPGMTRDRAEAVLRVTFNQLPGARAPTRRPVPQRLDVVSGAQGLNTLSDQFSIPLRVLMAMVGVVLVIACANVATLLLARAGARRQEIGLRLALGAGRGRLVRQLLTESLLLACIGGLLGIGVAFVASDLLVQIMSRGANPIELALQPNIRTLLFTLLVSGAAGLFFGIAPSLRSARQRLVVGMRGTVGVGEGRTSWSRVTIAAQVALCLVLLVEAGLFVRTLTTLRGVNIGFAEPETLLQVNVRATAGGGQPAKAVNLARELYGRLDQLGLRSATVSMDLPFSGLSMSGSLTIPDSPRVDEGPSVYTNVVGPRFFETMGIPLEGREFRFEDDERAPRVAVISRGAAQAYFPGTSAIGRRVRTSGGEVEIIGVSSDVYYEGVRGHPPLMLYLSVLQNVRGVGGLMLALRVKGDLETSIAALRRDMPTMTRDLVLARVWTFEERRDAQLVQERVVAILATVFGGLALLLGCVGLYGTMAYAVVRRTAEFGVRTALGARASTLVRMVCGESLRPVIAGIIVGLPLAFAAGRLSQSLLFGITSTDVTTYAVAVAMLLLAATSASLLPARRAATVDPIVALRSE